MKSNEWVDRRSKDRLSVPRRAFACGSVVSPNQPGLVLPGRILRLTECKPAIPSHTLYGADFLDSLLEPEMIRRIVSHEAKGMGMTRIRTALAEVDNLGCCISEAPVRYGRKRAYTSDGS